MSRAARPAPTGPAPPGPGGPAPASPAPASPAPASPAPASGGTSRSVATSPTDTWRRWRAPLGIVLVILLGGALIALLQPSAHQAGYLDPGDPGQFGTRALAHLLAHRGEPVIKAGTVQSAEAAALSASAPGGEVTLVITSPGLLSRSQLDRLAGVDASLLLVEPVPAELTAIAPGAAVAGDANVRLADPGCRLPAATLAGGADMGGVQLRSTAPGAWRCYPVDGRPSLVRYRTGGRIITVLGTGVPLTNQYLGSYGNAALALNLLGGSSRIVWLVPSLAPGGPAAGRPQVPAQPDPAARLPGRDPACHRRGTGRAVADAQAWAAGRRAPAGDRAGLGNRRGPRPPVPVAAIP